jgi:hypothetical protein
MVSVDNYGWRVEPQFDFFFWATRRMRLRAAVAFFQMVRHAKEVGVCVFRRVERRTRRSAITCGTTICCCPAGRCRTAGLTVTTSLYYIKGRKGEKLKLVEERKAA